MNKSVRQNMNPDGTFNKADVMPKYNGGDPAVEFNKFLDESLIFPVYASTIGHSGQVDVTFFIDTLGRIRNPEVINMEITDLGIEAIRVLSKSQNWEPGSQEGIPVNVKYFWTISFLPGKEYAIIIPSLLKEEEEYEEEEYFYLVEDMPTFNGGDPVTEFRKYISQVLQYPPIAAENGISGRVIVNFTVDKEGYIVNPVILVSADPALDAEAIRVIKSSPRWEPGFQRGKPVNVVYTFPINFDVQTHGSPMR